MNQPPYKLYYTDDDVDDRMLFEEVAGAINEIQQLSVFESGIHLLRHLESINEKDLPTSIVCDMKMHLMDGLEVLEKLKENPCWSKIPVTILTTSSSRLEKEKALKAGAKDFITKPVTISELEAIIRKILFYQ